MKQNKTQNFETFFKSYTKVKYVYLLVFLQGTLVIAQTFYIRWNLEKYKIV